MGANKVEPILIYDVKSIPHGLTAEEVLIKYTEEKTVLYDSTEGEIPQVIYPAGSVMEGPYLPTPELDQEAAAELAQEVKKMMAKQPLTFWPDSYSAQYHTPTAASESVGIKFLDMSQPNKDLNKEWASK